MAELEQKVQNAWDNLLQDTIWHLYHNLHAQIHACIASIGDTLYIDVTVWAPLTVTSHLNLLSYIPTMIRYCICHITYQ